VPPLAWLLESKALICSSRCAPLKRCRLAASGDDSIRLHIIAVGTGAAPFSHTAPGVNARNTSQAGEVLNPAVARKVSPVTRFSDQKWVTRGSPTNAADFRAC